jgi:PB1 domain
MTQVSKDHKDHTPVKVQMETGSGELEYRRLKLENVTTHYPAFESKLRSAFSVPADRSLVLEYRDADEEWILLSTTADLLIAIDHVDGSLLRVRLSTTAATATTPPTAPLVHVKAVHTQATQAHAYARNAHAQAQLARVHVHPASHGSAPPSTTPPQPPFAAPAEQQVFPNVEEMLPRERQHYIRSVFERDAVAPISDAELGSLPPRVAMRISRRRGKQTAMLSWRERKHHQQQQQQQQQYGELDDPTMNGKLRVHALLVRDTLSSNGGDDLTGMPPFVQKRVHNHRIKRARNPHFSSRFLAKWTPVLLREAPHMLPPSFVKHQPETSTAATTTTTGTGTATNAPATTSSSSAPGGAHCTACQCECHRAQPQRASVTLEEVCQVDDERTIPQEVLRLLPQQYKRAVRVHRAKRAAEAGSPIGRICRLDDEHPLADELLELLPNHVTRAVRAHREKVILSQ